VYGSNTTTTQNYNYVLDGSNVDVVIWDSGIQANHPEFQYVGNTTSRLQQEIWYAGLNPSTYYTDVSGHGTHVAGIAAGKTYGWAKNANIYSIKTYGTFDATANILINWHNNKTVNPVTGVKNPTVVNMSFGYAYTLFPRSGLTQYNIANVTYRGNTVSSPGYGSSSPYGLIFGEKRIPAWVLTYNQSVDLMIDAGIIICKSAGNDSQKIDVPGGIDWNNYVWLTYQANSAPAIAAFYMRGGSPTSSTSTIRGDAIVTGALDSTTFSVTLDQKASYSQAGPGVDIFAAGSDVMSATSNTNSFSGQAYYWNTSFKQVNIGGTSMASPQVAGAAALYLQAHPTATPAQVRSALINVATTTMIGNISTNPSGNDYSNTVSQWGGNAGVAYQPIQGLTQIKASGNTWQSPANITIKTDANTWTTVSKVWTKTSANTWIQTY
jgi:subtilisin family serine protease